MNPFDLRGPQFLMFYLVFGAVTLAIAAWMRQANESGPSSSRPMHDYLEIAFLRGGSAEAIRVAILTLIDRGLLGIVRDNVVQAALVDPKTRVAKATERSILEKCKRGSATTALFSDSTVTAAATGECEGPLVHAGLLPNADQRVSRRRLFLLAAGLLLVVAAIKILVAIARGRFNLGFLVVETVVFVILAGIVTHPRRTPAGNALLADLRTLFAGLKERAETFRPYQGGSDFALLAAVFGVGAALPVYPDAKALFPKARDSSGGSGCGSSCGSSCGGGGCGGGCGGCGG